MAQPNGSKAVVSSPESAIPEPAVVDESMETAAASPVDGASIDDQAIDDTFAALKTLLGTVEKLQKARQTVGDIKPLLIRLLDGEMLSGEDLELLKGGIGGLGKLVKLYSDYQDALAKAQPARALLDTMLKTTSE